MESGTFPDNVDLRFDSNPTAADISATDLEGALDATNLASGDKQAAGHSGNNRIYEQVDEEV